MEKQTLPNSNLVLIFGILSIIGCCCTGFLGAVFGIIAIVMANKATVLYNESPELYEGYSNVKTGKILAIIGLIFGIISTIYTVWMLFTLGVDGYTQFFEEFSKGFQEGMSEQ